MTGFSPMQKVVRELRRKGVEIENLNALDVFGGKGVVNTKDYASLVSSIEVWEYDPKHERDLKRRFPFAKVKITNSFEEIKHTQQRYSLINVDNPPYAHGGFFEHFEMFSDILRIAENDTILILNVLPEISGTRKGNPLFGSDIHLASRRTFYETESPQRMSLEETVAAYERIIKKNGFRIVFYFFNKLIFGYHFVVRIKKLEHVSPEGNI
jgi:hypothetical protein